MLGIWLVDPKLAVENSDSWTSSLVWSQQYDCADRRSCRLKDGSSSLPHRETAFDAGDGIRPCDTHVPLHD